MSLPILAVVLVAVAVYWFMTQIRPDRQRASLLRPGLADGLLSGINEARHEQGLPILELDEELMQVAENKATHQVQTGRSEEGWDYPSGYADLLGQSLMMETLLTGPAESLSDRLIRVRDLFDDEWIRCGIGVAGGKTSQIVVALVLCREAWEPFAEKTPKRSLAERLVLGD